MFEGRSYVLAIARTGSFTAAAAELYVSQPSLSACIRRLEQRIGEPLFERGTHPVSLTPCGEEYVRVACAMEDLEEGFATFVSERRGCVRGELRLGGSNFNITCVLPELYQRFQERYPGIQVDVVEGDIDRLEMLLMQGRVDFVLDSCEMDAAWAERFPLRSERLLLAAPERFLSAQMRACALTGEEIRQGLHTRADRPRMPLAAFSKLPYISLTPQTDTFRRVRRLCAQEDFHPKPCLSFSQQSTAYKMVCAGIGMGFVSDVLAAQTAPGTPVVFFALPESEALRQICLYKKKSRRMRAPMRAFAALAQQVFEDS